MKILGVGVDIIKYDRFKTLTLKKNFLLRTFSKNEIDFSKAGSILKELLKK